MSAHHHGHSGQPSDDETILGADGDQFPPGGGVVGGFGSEFPAYDPEAGVPASERGLPPLTPAEQEEVEREADAAADDPEARDAL